MALLHTIATQMRAMGLWRALALPAAGMMHHLHHHSRQPWSVAAATAVVTALVCLAALSQLETKAARMHTYELLGAKVCAPMPLAACSVAWVLAA